jgi:acyl-CoA thioester hydrolase
MYMHTTKIRVRYSETDRMGYVYYGNYSVYFEVGRVDALREAGISYKELEDNGIMLPVLEYNIKYFKPAYYDDQLSIRTVIEEIRGSRIFFTYKTYNESGELINEASTTLVFVDRKTGRPTRPPQYIIEKIDDSE